MLGPHLMTQLFEFPPPIVDSSSLVPATYSKAEKKETEKEEYIYLITR